MSRYLFPEISSLKEPMPRVAAKDAEGKGGGRKGVRNGETSMLPFAAARAIVRKLKLKSNKEWLAWGKSGQRPSNIPGCPHQVYRDDGWISMPDWLGYETTRAPRGQMLSFTVARAIVRKLKLKGNKEWYAWSKSGQRPSNIPAGPRDTYRDDGWISYPDWLGYKGQARHEDMLPFAVARAIVRKLKLKGQKEWLAWSKSGQRPSNIPSNPDRTYRDDGWISYPDWLGYGSTGGAAASQSSASSSSATTTPKKKTKRKRRPAAPHPDAPPPPPPPSSSHPKRRIKTEEPHPGDTSGNPTSTADDPPPRKIKKEEEEGAC
jgi:hypothetical protein